MTCTTLAAKTTPRTDPPRSIGRLGLDAVGASGGTRLARLAPQGALKALFPRRRSPALDAILINTSGGITGGDRLRIDASATDGAHLRVTTQACERAYRAAGPAPGRVSTTLTVGDGARLDWLPQETLIFDGAHLVRRLCLALGTDARAVVVEPLIFGRAAMGERPVTARLHDRIEVARNGIPLFIDPLRLGPDMAAQLDRPGVMGGAGAMATVLCAGPNAAGHLSALRAVLPPTGGASLVRDDLLVARILASDGFVLRQSLIPILTLLTEDALPRSWMT